MIFNMIDQLGSPGATPKGEGQGFVVDKNVKLTDPVALANAEPSTGILTEPERLAKADPVFLVVKEKRLKGHHPSATEAYGKKPDKRFFKLESPKGTDMDEIMQKVSDPVILAQADKLYKERGIKIVEDGLKELAKGGSVGEAKIPDIPVKPVREDAPSRLTRAGWRTTQNNSQLTSRTVRDVFPASGKK